MDLTPRPSPTGALRANLIGRKVSGCGLPDATEDTLEGISVTPDGFGGDAWRVRYFVRTKTRWYAPRPPATKAVPTHGDWYEAVFSSEHLGLTDEMKGAKDMWQRMADTIRLRVRLSGEHISNPRPGRR